MRCNIGADTSSKLLIEAEDAQRRLLDEAAAARVVLDPWDPVRHALTRFTPDACRDRLAAADHEMSSLRKPERL